MQIPKKSEYPFRIKINKVFYTIIFVEQIEYRDPFGLCDFERKVILLKNKQSQKDLFKTFLHEILHAMEFEYNIPITHKIIYQLEESVFQLLKDNFK